MEMSLIYVAFFLHRSVQEAGRESGTQAGWLMLSLLIENGLRPSGHIFPDQTNSAIEVVLKYTLHRSVPGLPPSQGHSKRQDGWCLGCPWW